jgi:7-carboxy-7-deazaguanine synthase
MLAGSGYKALLETSGSEPIDAVPKDVHIIMDLKCPDSKMSEHNLWKNLDDLKPSDEIKFVVASKNDFDWANQVCLEKNLYENHSVLFSPAWGLTKEKDLCDWMLEASCTARLNLQQHKFIWGPRKKGV